MKKYILLIIIIGFGTTSCSDYLDSEYIFKDRESLEKIFTDYDKTEQWLHVHIHSLPGNAAM